MTNQMNEISGAADGSTTAPSASPAGDGSRQPAGGAASTPPGGSSKKSHHKAPEPKNATPGRPGRPPGAKNVPKPKPLVTVRRKAASEYTDTKAALDSLAADARTVAEKHNREHPGDQWSVEIRKAATVAKLTPEMCADIFETAADLLGTSLQVDSRPTPKAVRKVGTTWSAASAYLPVGDPMWMAFGMALAATFGALAPMLAEKKARSTGLISGPIDPHYLANMAEATAAAEAEAPKEGATP